MDRHQTAEDEYSGTRAIAGYAAAAYRKVQGFGQRQEPTALPRTVESEGELLPEGDCRPLRYRQGSDIPHGPPHVRHDSDAGQRCTHRDGLEDARPHEHSDNADLCPSDRHEDQQRHGGPGPQVECPLDYSTARNYSRVTLSGYTATIILFLSIYKFLIFLIRSIVFWNPEKSVSLLILLAKFILLPAVKVYLVGLVSGI